MKNITKNLFVISFVLAIIASITAFIYLKSFDKGNKDIGTTTIIVASQNIPSRTVIVEEMIREVSVSEDIAYGNFITDKTEIIGSYSKEAIFQGERFHKEKFLNQVDELSMRIKGNNRAISVNVPGDAGVADLIKSGDYVDIMVYLPEVKENGRIVRQHIAKIMLQNLEVLAIDKQMNRDYNGLAESEVPQSLHVTLSVPVNDIEKIVLAEDIGQLKLALRPLDGDYIHTSDGTIWQELLLDDNYQMKDMFPQYEVKSLPKSIVNGEYTYDKYYYYTIKHGDTLRKISTNFYGDANKYDLIKQVNRIDDEDEIIAGTGIKIPVLN